MCNDEVLNFINTSFISSYNLDKTQIQHLQSLDTFLKEKSQKHLTDLDIIIREELKDKAHLKTLRSIRTDCSKLLNCDFDDIRKSFRVFVHLIYNSIYETDLDNKKIYKYILSDGTKKICYFAPLTNSWCALFLLPSGKKKTLSFKCLEDGDDEAKSRALSAVLNEDIRFDESFLLISEDIDIIDRTIRCFACFKNMSPLMSPCQHGWKYFMRYKAKNEYF